MQYPWRDETAENTMALVQNICNRILSKRHACHDLKSAIPGRYMYGFSVLSLFCAKFL